VEDPYFREMCSAIFEAGRDAGISGSGAKHPKLSIQGLQKHATAEFDVLQATLLHYNKVLFEAALGNPCSFTMSDIVTLADGKPYLSIGSFSICPRSLVPMHTYQGFANVPDKTDPTTCDNMQQQPLRFAGVGQTSIAHTIVADRAATPGVGNQLDRRHPPPVSHLKKMTKKPCGLHGHSKPVQFTTGQCGYKDGQGGDLWDMPELNKFTDDIAAYEVEMRKKDVHAALLKAAALVPGGSATLKLRSNFNTTRASGDYEQLITIIRMHKARQQFEMMFPGVLKNKFVGLRLAECVECIAPKSALMSLVKKSQFETCQTAGYWCKWRRDVFTILTGKQGNMVIDLHAVGPSPKLSLILRARHNFTVLGNIFRARAMLEYKRRFGSAGMEDGTDVTDVWELEMTPELGTPMLLDPRLNNNPKSMGLDPANKAPYLDILHDAHYEYYLVQRERHLTSLVEAHEKHQSVLRDRDAAAAAAAVAAGKEEAPVVVPVEAGNTLLVAKEIDMGYECSSDDEATTSTDVSTRITVPPPTLPLVDPVIFREDPERQYKNYKAACRKPNWASLYPQLLDPDATGPVCL
jgi:hypothetical protein